MDDMSKFSDFMKHEDGPRVDDARTQLRPTVETSLIGLLDIDRAKQELIVYSDAVKGMVDIARAHEVTDEPSMKRAVEMELQSKRLVKAIKEKTAEFLKEPEEYVKAVKNFVKSWTSDLEAIVKELKRKEADFQWRMELDRRKQEEVARKAQVELQKKIDAEAKKAGVEAPKLPEPIIPPKRTVVRTEEGSAYVRTEWKGTIVDPDKVPRAYCSPDQKKINEAVRMGIRDIEGVDIKEVPISVSRM